MELLHKISAELAALLEENRTMRRQLAERALEVDVAEQAGNPGPFSLRTRQLEDQVTSLIADNRRVRDQLSEKTLREEFLEEQLRRAELTNGELVRQLEENAGQAPEGAVKAP